MHEDLCSRFRPSGTSGRLLMGRLAGPLGYNNLAFTSFAGERGAGVQPQGVDERVFGLSGLCWMGGSSSLDNFYQASLFLRHGYCLPRRWAQEGKLSCFFFNRRSMDSHATGVLVSPRLGVLETRRFGRDLSALYRPPPSPLSLPRPPSSVASSLVAPAV